MDDFFVQSLPFDEPVVTFLHQVEDDHGLEIAHQLADALLMEPNPEAQMDQFLNALLNPPKASKNLQFICDSCDYEMQV